MAFLNILRTGAVVAALTLVSACDDDGRLPRNGRHYVPIPGHLVAQMAEKNTTKFQPILLRAYKKESELEVWKQNISGEYVLLKTYPMCRWSGQLGPKHREGDRQVPEGFYSITPAQLNPNSSFYLSFNVGYPNAYDRAHGRTGSHIMVHGACSSAGCFSMTDEQIAEIYALTREAFAGGQQAIQLQSFPFRFSPENLAKYRADPNMPFWKTLKEGADSFDLTKQETKVTVCERRYVFNRKAKDGAKFEASSACPPSEVDDQLVAAVERKKRADETRVAELVASGASAMRRIYKDGDQHPSFRVVQMASVSADGNRLEPTRANVSRVEVISRPDDLEHGPVDIPVEELKSKASKPARELAALLPLRREVAPAAAATTPASGPAVASARPAAATPAPAQAAAARPAPTPQAQPAAAQAATPVNASAGQPSTPFLQGLLGWGARSESPTSTVQAIEPAQPQKVDVPLPPRAPARAAAPPRPDRAADASPLVGAPRRANELAALQR